MKRLISMLLVIGVAIFFFGCQKDIIETDLSMDDQETTALKKAKVKRTFEGICTFVFPPATEGDNEWYDVTDDWRTTGTSIWVTTITEPGTDPGVTIIGGTTELFVAAKNPHEENRGKWEMTWEGTLRPNEAGDGLDIVGYAVGKGVAGKVKGMKGNWTYTMNYVGADFPNPANPTFFYIVEGNIDKTQGPIKKD